MQFRFMNGVALPLLAEEQCPLTPPAAEPVEDDEYDDEYDDDDESTGDSWDLDDCAAEGTVPPDVDTPAPDRLPQLVAMVLRLRRLEAALNAVNNYAQVVTFRLEALERQMKRQAEEQAATLAMEVRALDAAREVA